MKQKILFTICILFGLMFINAGLNKFFNYMPVPDDLPENLIKLMTAMMEIGWLMPLVAVTEIVGGILFMIPKFRAIGAIVILPIMVGIILTNIAASPSNLPLPLILLIIEFWVIYENKDKYLSLIK